jgi:hypothetical protein
MCALFLNLFNYLLIYFTHIGRRLKTSGTMAAVAKGHLLGVAAPAERKIGASSQDITLGIHEINGACDLH